MTFFQSIILGIVQGITEFLPISSSAHLVLIPYLLNWRIPEEQLFPFDVLVQLGTLVALIYYYREDLWIIIKAVFKGIISGKPLAEVEARVGWLTALASVPAGIVGFTLRKAIKGTFTNPALTAVFLFITAALLVLGEVFGKKQREIDNLNWKDALWIGCFQAVSLLPGISRSGSTITGGMTRNLKRKTAGQFSFLMAIPAFMGAGLVGTLEMLRIPDLKNFLPVMVTGFLIAMVVGFLAISWLIKYIGSHSLLPFAGYCLLMGAGSLLLLTLNPQYAVINSSSLTVGNSQTYAIGFEPDLEWMLPAMNDCRQSAPKAEFSFQPYASISAASADTIAFLSYQLPENLPENVYRLGGDQLVMAVNSANSFSKSSLSLVDSLFAGRLGTWQAVSGTCPVCFTASGAAANVSVNIWTLPLDSYLGDQFAKTYLASPVSSLAKIAPNSKTLRQMLSTDANAIGMLPAGWLDSTTKAVTITDENWSAPGLDILATTPSAPDSNLSLWLACVQKSLPQ